MKLDEKKKTKAKKKPKKMENKKIDCTSSFDNSLFWTTAGPIPALLNILKKEIKTVTSATTPNSSGDNNLANTAPIIIDIITPEYLGIAVYITPDNIFFKTN